MGLESRALVAELAALSLLISLEKPNFLTVETKEVVSFESEKKQRAKANGEQHRAIELSSNIRQG